MVREKVLRLKPAVKGMAFKWRDTMFGAVRY